MHISVPWAIALVAAGLTAVLALVGIAAQRGLLATPKRPVAHAAHLLGGGLTGFLALAFAPAWPLLAAIAGALMVRALQARRTADLGLLLCGFGAAWTLLLGNALVADLTDPAVLAPDVMPWLVLGAATLLTGALIVLADATSS